MVPVGTTYMRFGVPLREKASGKVEEAQVGPAEAHRKTIILKFLPGPACEKLADDGHSSSRTFTTFSPPFSFRVPAVEG